ncbi:Rrf2 family transcriptional regulator [Paucilactobacillus nenjiangensis]|uniref:Rrf2 family transcriptional regulator n=1 Tax=Paucilactobacillus nenjiangensis TaxID=1296540 RepID=UPI0010FA14AD|nr:Rrf2 family transcriptional regulator [Paucilactobacillus nenjiangensis]
MRLSTKFSDALHLLVFINVFSDIKITSDLIAISIKTSPVVVRRLIGSLRDAGIIINDPNNHQPIFAKEPSEITMFDVYLATEGHTALFEIDHDTNAECTVGGNIQEVLNGFYTNAEAAAYKELNRISMQEVIDQILIADKLKKARAAQ